MLHSMLSDSKVAIKRPHCFAWNLSIPPGKPSLWRNCDNRVLSLDVSTSFMDVFYLSAHVLGVSCVDVLFTVSVVAVVKMTM